MPMLRGQMISMLIALTGVFASLLAAAEPRSQNFPVLMAFLNYALCSTYVLRPLIRNTVRRLVMLLP